jgi:branched-chain amino acid transport system substrate-binding protein
MRQSLLARWVAAATALALLASACSGSALVPGATTSPGGATGGGDVAIGFQTPLSAPGAVALGQQAQRGAELGIEYVNTVMGGVLGGRKLVMHTEDTQGQNETGIAGYRRLVTEKKVVATFGYIHSSVLIAVNEVAKELGVPTMATGASAKDVTSKHYDTAFRVHYIDPARAAVWLQLIKAKAYKRVALISEDSDYGIGLVNELRVQKPTNLAFEVQTNVVDRTAVDVTPQLLKIKDWKPDLLINITTGKQQDLVIDQAAQIGMFPAVQLLNAGPETLAPTYWQLHPKNGVGLMASAYFHPKQPLSEAAVWMTKKYKEKYGNEEPVYFSLNAFGQVVIIAQALDLAKSTDPKKLIQALETGTFKGWSDAPVTMPKADGVYWHNWSPPGLIVQYTKEGQDWREAPIVVQAEGNPK